MDPLHQLNQTLVQRHPNEILRIARILIGNIYTWSQGARARDDHGRPVPPNHPRACCWSVLGAIAVASNPRGLVPPYFLHTLDALAYERGFLRLVLPPANDWERYLDSKLGPAVLYESVDEMNDFCTHTHVLNLLDAAIHATEGLVWYP